MNFVGRSRSISSEEVSSLCVSETEDDLKPAGGEKEASRERLDMMMLTWMKIWLSHGRLFAERTVCLQYNFDHEILRSVHTHQSIIERSSNIIAALSKNGSDEGIR
jgi:hypothetical protein